MQKKNIDTSKIEEVFHFDKPTSITFQRFLKNCFLLFLSVSSFSSVFPQCFLLFLSVSSFFLSVSSFFLSGSSFFLSVSSFFPIVAPRRFDPLKSLADLEHFWLTNIAPLPGSELFSESTVWGGSPTKQPGSAWIRVKPNLNLT